MGRLLELERQRRQAIDLSWKLLMDRREVYSNVNLLGSFEVNLSEEIKTIESLTGKTYQELLDMWEGRG
jgi:hypothetical protein